MKKQGIQMLRVLACLSVFAVHFGQRLGLNGPVRQVTDLGQYGVQLFFVICGYLACVSLEKSTDDSFWSSTLKYYKRRMVRILPLYYFCICFFFVTEVFLWKDVPADSYGLYWFRYLFFLNAVFPSEGYFWGNLGITWTIPVFVFFYAVFPFVHRVVNSSRKATVAFVISVALALLQKTCFHGYFSAFASLSKFFLGICVYYSEKDGTKTALILGSLVAACSVFDFIGPATGISGVFAVLLYAVNNLSLPRPFQAVVQTIDQYSFDIYLCHGIVFCGILDKISFSRPVRLLIALLGTAILSLAAHFFIEKPCQKLLRSGEKNKESGSRP